MWTFDTATGSLFLDGTLIGDGATVLPPGDYTLGPVTDFDAGVPIIGDAGTEHLGPGGLGLNVTPDIMQRVIASKITTISIIDSAAAVAGAAIEAAPEAPPADPAPVEEGAPA